MVPHMVEFMADWLSRNLTEVFQLPEAATEWLLSLFNVIQVFDDVADGDAVSRADLDRALYDALAGWYSNPFFASNAGNLVPLLAVNILKWQASDRVEREGKAGPVSFTWRAGYYDVVLMVVQICHGRQFATENAHLVMALYGESFDEYLAEFNHA